MAPNRRLVILGTLALVGIIAGLVGLSFVFPTQWGTFIPDAIIGLAGAGSIAVIIFYADRRDQTKRERASNIAAAYERLFDTLVPLRGMQLDAQIDMAPFSTMATRMLQLSDWVADTEPELAVWLEAERQLGLSRLLDSIELVSALSDPSVDETLEAYAPFLKWIAELASNLRFWRTGRLTKETMSEQARQIEALLRAKSRWREKAMPWRDVDLE